MKAPDGLSLEINRATGVVTMHVGDPFRHQCLKSLESAYCYIAYILGVKLTRIDEEDMDKWSDGLKQQQATLQDRLARDVGYTRSKSLLMELGGKWISEGYPSEEYAREFFRLRGLRV